MKYRPGEERIRTTIYLKPEIKHILEQSYKGNISQFIEEIILERFNSEEEKLAQIKELQEKIVMLSDAVMESRQSIMDKQSQELEKIKQKAKLEQYKLKNNCAICGKESPKEKKVLYNRVLCKDCFLSLSPEQMDKLKMDQ